MKKNKMMRIASILLVVTLLSTCVISGTFAKYVTKAEGKDMARVAKWGIIIGIEGDGAFKTQYENDEVNKELPEGFTPYPGDYTVVANEEIDLLDMDEPEKVVAPGTKGDGLKGTVMGTPEVATRYMLVIKDWTDIVLPAGDDYVDYTNLVYDEDEGTWGYTDTFSLAKDYSPIKWDITVTKYKEDGTVAKQIGLLSEAAKKLGIDMEANGIRGFSAAEAKVIVNKYAGALESLLESLAPTGASNPQVNYDEDTDTVTLSMDFDPNVAMNYSFELNWLWNFEGIMTSVTGTGANDSTTFDAETVDKADTYLGNWIAYAAGQDIPDFEAPEDGSYIIKATVLASATQID